MSSFFEELKRRNVFRVGVAYVVVSWLIIQVIETVSDPLGLPEWTEAFFIVLLLAGLPLVLIFSWAFELTPEGIKKTKDVDATESVTADTGKKLNYTIIAVLVLALGYSLWDRQGLVDQSGQAEDGAAAGTASVAVLPFVNMSADAEQEYFSDGISEELLNLLAKIPEMRVPARTSSFQFKGQNLDIGDVAEQLNVDHVLEGSVRKSGMKVRVTAQLIEADTGYHLWSETYDRELTDIFAIQDEISAAIVAALAETLGIDSVAAPKVAAQTDAEAYNAYLLGQHQLKLRSKLSIESAVQNFERALEIDPDYAPAHAGAGLGWYLLTASFSTYGTLPLDESLAKAMPHLERALEIDPDLPEALGAYGLVLDAQLKYEEAVPYFEKALALNPSLTDVRNWYSATLVDLAEYDESVDQLRKAYELDPLSILTLNNYTNQLITRSRFDEAEPVLERLEQIDPDRGIQFRARMEFQRGEAAAGTEYLLRLVDRDSTRLVARRVVSHNLWAMELKEAALGIWPYPDNVYALVNDTSDVEEALRLALENYAKNPNEPSVKQDLAWAHWRAGKREASLEYAAEFLDTLGESSARISFANILFALDARERGDEEEVLNRIGPVEAIIDQALAIGADVPELHRGKALILELRGESEAALDSLEKAVAQGHTSPESFAVFFDTAGWSGRPEFDSLLEQYRDHIAAERAKLLEIACGSNGFEIWQPSPEDCGKHRATPGPT